MWHVAAGYSQKLTPKLSGQIDAGCCHSCQK